MIGDMNWLSFLKPTTASSFKIHPTKARDVLDIVQRNQAAARAKARDQVEGTPNQASVASDTSESLIEDNEDDFSEEEGVKKKKNTRADKFPSLPPLVTIEPQQLDVDHPLFGTECFSWPIVIWNEKRVGFSDANNVGIAKIRQFINKSARIRDGKYSPKELKKIKERAEEALFLPMQL